MCIRDSAPIGVVAIAYAAIVLPKDRPSPSESFDFVGMLMLSPGLAAFLFGVSSIPEQGTVFAGKVLIPAVIGALLIIAFVFHAFRPAHPLIDLRLFNNRNLTIAVIAMFLFCVAFFGAGLFIPSYFLQVRGESTLQAGLLMAPQGLGAMLTMPLAGKLVDKMPVGRVVPFGILGIILGMGVFTQLSVDTPYALVLGALFVMGMGMGATMMPIMTSALKALNDHEIARGSTLVNIVQQIASSVGAAVMSVVLTNNIKGSEPASALSAAQNDPSIMERLTPDVIARGLADMTDGFAMVFTVSLALVIVTLIPVLLMPRKHEESHIGEGADDASDAPPVLLH